MEKHRKNDISKSNIGTHTLIKKVTLQLCMSRVSDVLQGVRTFVSIVVFGTDYECPKCGTTLDGEPELCPSCGRQLL